MNSFKGASGFIFDCDGTLLDTLDAWEEAERDLFAQAGPLTQEQEDEIHSAPIEQAAAILHERYGVGESADAVLSHLDGFLVDYYANKAEALPGACEFVSKAYEQGIPCVVVSSSPRRYLDAGLKRAGIRNCFADLVTTDEVGCSKKEARIYQHALDVLRSQADSTWAFDDAPYAIAAMHDFGLRTVCIGARHALQADKDVESFLDIIEQF